MVAARRLHGCTMVNNKVIALGGLGDGDVENVEIFTEDNGWQKIHSMRLQIWGHQLVNNGKMTYAIGGYNKGASSDIFQIDVENEIITKVKTIETARYLHVAFLLPYGFLKSCEGE